MGLDTQPYMIQAVISLLSDTISRWCQDALDDGRLRLSAGPSGIGGPTATTEVVGMSSTITTGRIPDSLTTSTAYFTESVLNQQVNYF